MNYDNQNEQDKIIIFAAAQALRNRIRQQIFLELIKKNNQSFNDLVCTLNISQSKLAYHLQIMIDHNIITNFYDKRVGIKDHSFYELSAFGQELLTGTPLNIEPEPSDQIEMTNNIKSTSANFRTLHHIEYRSYEKVPLKRTNKSLKPFKVHRTDYFDPWLEFNVKNATMKSKKTKKITLSSTRQYYLSYKHPFTNISQDNVHIQY